MTAGECAELLHSLGAVEVRVDPEHWFTWTSGERAPIYCDNRLLISFPEQRAQIADALAAAIEEHHPQAELIAGTATAGIPHAAWVAERLELPMVYVRGAAKEHGRARRIEGRRLSGERVVLVEDLISFGGSVSAAALALQEEGGKLIGVQAIVSWSLPAAVRRLEALGVPWHALVGYEEIIDCLELEPAERRSLLEWRESLRE